MAFVVVRPPRWAVASPPPTCISAAHLLLVSQRAAFPWPLRAMPSQEFKVDMAALQQRYQTNWNQLVAVSGVAKSFGSARIVHGVDLAVGDGLESTTAGTIAIGGRDVTALDPGERRLAEAARLLHLGEPTSRRQVIQQGLARSSSARSSQSTGTSPPRWRSPAARRPRTRHGRCLCFARGRCRLVGGP